MGDKKILFLDEARQHLEFLFSEKPKEYWIEITTIGETVIPRFFQSIDEVLAWLKKNEKKLANANVYVGVHPRKVKPEKGRGKEEHVDKVWVLFCDLDWKEQEPPKWQDVASKLEEAGLPIPSFVVFSGSQGYHCYWKLLLPIDTKRGKKLQEKLVKALQRVGLPADVKARDLARILRLAGTYNCKPETIEKYGKPQLCYIIQPDNGVRIDPDNFEQLLDEILGNEEKKKEKRQEIKKTKAMHFVKKAIQKWWEDPQKWEEVKKQFVQLLKPFWKQGYRYFLTGYLVGFFFKIGLPKEKAAELIEAVCDAANDEEKERRLYLVEYHYNPERVKQVLGEKFREEGLSEEEIKRRIEEEFEKWKTIAYKGLSGVQEVLEEQLKKELGEGPDVSAEASKIIEQLRELFRAKFPYLTIVYEKEPGRIVSYKNTARGILKVVSKLKKIKNEETGNEELVWVDRTTWLAYFNLERIVVYRDIETNQELYTIEIRFRDGSSKIYDLRQLSEIIDALIEERGVAAGKDELRRALSSLIQAAVEKKLAEFKEGYMVTGLVEKKGKLEFNQLEDMKTLLPPINANISKEKIKEAIDLLFEIAKFYDQRKFWTAIGWAVLAPLAWCFRKRHKLFPHLLLFGWRGTGKSTLAIVILRMYGLTTKWEIGDVTLAKLVRKIDITTFPVVGHEANRLLSRDECTDVLNLAATEEKVREIAKGKEKRAGYEFFSRAGIILVSNKLVRVAHGLKRRIIALEFTLKDEPTREQRLKFNRELLPKLEELRYLGWAIIKYYIENWDKMKNKIFSIPEELDEYPKAGLQILKEVMQQYGINHDIPMLDSDSMSTFEEEEIVEPSLKEIIKKALISAMRDVLVLDRDMVTKLRQGNIETWKNIFTELQRVGSLPLGVFIGKDKKTGKDIVIFTAMFLDHLKKRMDFDFAGSLENFATLIGGTYTKRYIADRTGRKRQRRVVLVELDKFIEWLCEKWEVGEEEIKMRTEKEIEEEVKDITGEIIKYLSVNQAYSPTNGIDKEVLVAIMLSKLFNGDESKRDLIEEAIEYLRKYGKIMVLEDENGRSIVYLI